MSGFENEFFNLINIITSPTENKANKDQAESFIYGYANSQFNNFISCLVNIMLNEEVSDKYRLFTGTMIKNLIKGIIANVSKRWYNDIPPNERTIIKQNLLSGLGAKSKKIVTQFAHCIASICYQEFPNKEYQEIIEVLSDIAATETHDPTFRFNAIHCINIILQDVDVSSIEEKYTTLIAKAIYFNLQPSEGKAAQEEGIDALCTAISCFGNLMSDQALKNHVLGMVYNSFSFDYLVSGALRCLSEIAKHFYFMIGDQMGKFYEITASIIEKSQDEDLVIKAYEMWICIASIEKKLIKNSMKCENYISVCENNLFHFCNSTIAKTKLEDFNAEATSSPCKSAIILLQKISFCCSDSYINKVFEEIGKYLNEGNEYKTFLGLVLFQSILKTEHKDCVFSIVKQSLTEILKYLANPNNYIQRITTEILLAISEVYFNGFDEAEVEFIITGILHMISNEKDQYVLSNIIFSAHYVFKHFTLESSTSLLSKYITLFINSLNTHLMNPDHYNVQNQNIPFYTALALGTLIEHAPTDCNKIIEQYLVELISNIAATLDNSQFSDRKFQLDLQTYLISILGTILLTKRVELDKEKVSWIYSQVIKSFENRNSIYVEGIQAINNLITCSESLFKDFVSNFFKYIETGLNNFYDKSIAKACMLSLDDIINNLPEQGISVNSLLDKVIQISNSPEADKELRHIAIMIFTDYVMRHDFNEFFFNQILTTVMFAMEFCCMLPNESEDEDLIDYKYKLRDSLIEFLNIVITRVIEINKTSVLESNIVKILIFLGICLKKEYNPTQEVKYCCYILFGDICAEYKDQLKNYKNEIPFNLLNPIHDEFKETEYSPSILLASEKLKTFYYC